MSGRQGASLAANLYCPTRRSSSPRTIRPNRSISTGFCTKRLMPREVASSRLTSAL